MVQDQGLDLLHGVILRQKSMAQQIGVEVTQQNHLIDDIGERGKVLPVFVWIRDIFVRIRIRGSVPLTNGSGSGIRSCHFRP
jgi:hypothetical protein